MDCFHPSRAGSFQTGGMRKRKGKQAAPLRHVAQGLHSVFSELKYFQSSPRVVVFISREELRKSIGKHVGELVAFEINRAYRCGKTHRNCATDFISGATEPLNCALPISRQNLQALVAVMA